MIDIATRNRQLKKVLEAHYGRGQVRVTGGKGTSYGWVHVRVAIVPGDWQAEYRRVHELVTAAGIELSHYNSDEGNGPRMACMNIEFRRAETPAQEAA